MSATNKGGMTPIIGPITGTAVNIPAIMEVEAAKLTPKIVRTIQVIIPPITPHKA